jgi:ABC-type amino acid transport substrate-binding protein
MKFQPIEPYIHNPIVIVMTNTHKYVSDLNELSSKKIAILKDYGYTADIYKKYPNINF